MITDVNNSVIMTSTVAGYANKPWRGEIKNVEPAEKEEGEENEMQTGASPVVKYEKIKRRTGYDGDPRIVMIEKIRTPLGRRTKGGKQEGREEGWKMGKCKKKMHFQADSLSAIRRRCGPWRIRRTRCRGR